VNLRWPDELCLPSYIRALRRGWSPNTIRPEAAQEELEAIDMDPAAFLRGLVDRDASGPPVRLPDGTVIPRIPGFRKWMWDGEFCGSIGLRWQPGTSELPSHVLGHVGYSVVPWKRDRGYATSALGQILVDAAAEGLAYVELTTDVHNIASQRVIEANQGWLVETFRTPEAFGGGESRRYRIDIGHLATHSVRTSMDAH
jgi:predicted acetyltransferase